MYKKIDIYVNGQYFCSTNRAKTCKKAIANFKAVDWTQTTILYSPGLETKNREGKVTARFSKA